MTPDATRAPREPMVSVNEHFIVPESALDGVLDTLCNAVLACGGIVRGETTVTGSAHVGWWHWRDGNLDKSGSFRYDHPEHGVSVPVYRVDPTTTQQEQQ